MEHYTVSGELLQRLSGGKATLEFRAPDGAPLGYYVPKNKYAALLAELDMAQPYFEEIRRQGLEDYAAGRCVTTEQLLAEFEEIRRSMDRKPTR